MSIHWWYYLWSIDGLLPSIDQKTVLPVYHPALKCGQDPICFQVAVNNFNYGMPLINGMYIISLYSTSTKGI